VNKLQLINNVLSLIGEQPLLSSSGRLGLLTVNAINTAIITVAQESRHQSFEVTTPVTVTAPDYLTEAYRLPDNVLQVLAVNVRQSTGSALGDSLTALDYVALEELPRRPSYSISSSSIFVSPTLARPLTLSLRLLTHSSLPASDSAPSGLPANVESVVSHAAAAILNVSYLDDANQSAIQRNLAGQLSDKLRTQTGVGRGRTFSMGKEPNASRFASTGFSSVNSTQAYAPLNSPALTGIPTAPTAAPLTSTTQVATAEFTTLAIGANNATIASTYATIANLNLKANIASPAFTGVPTVPTAPPLTNTTQAASTAFTTAAIAANNSAYTTTATLASTYTTKAEAAIAGRPAFARRADGPVQTFAAGKSFVSFATVDLDTNSATNATTFTAPVAGFYVFSASIFVANTGVLAGFSLGFDVNGVDYIYAFSNFTPGQQSAMTGTIMVQLAAGGTCKVFVNAATTFTVSLSTVTRFHGLRVNV